MQIHPFLKTTRLRRRAATVCVRLRPLGFVLILSVTALSVSAQTLDFPDYRPRKDNFAKVAEKDIHDDLIYFTLAGLDLRVGKPLATSMPVENYGSNYISFADQGIRVIITSGDFVAAKHKLVYIEKHLVRIDAHPYFGNYGLVPQRTIQSVTLINGKDTVHVPPAAFSDLFEPLFMYSEAGTTKTHDGVYFSTDRHTVYIYMLNREDNNAFYEVTWVIRNGQYLRRVVDAGI
jgi:hypothetical protein